MSVTSARYLPLTPFSRVTASSPEAAIAGSKPPSVRASSTMVWTGASSSTTKTTSKSSNAQTPPALAPSADDQPLSLGNRDFVPAQMYKSELIVFGSRRTTGGGGTAPDPP